MKHVKPKVVVSKCLGFDSCRYNGQMISDGFVKHLDKFVDFTPVCPEVEIGLGVPRMPIRIFYKSGKLRLIQPATGKDVTKKMHSFAKDFLSGLFGVDGFILKYRSPSCGPSNVKIDGYPQDADFPRRGMFSVNVYKLFPGLAIEDEGRLRNFEIREHFLTKLFTLARFKLAQDEGKASSLVDFHTRHKFLLMSYSPSVLEGLGRIVAAKKEPEKKFKEYMSALYSAMHKRRTKGRMVNTFQHIFGFFSDALSDKEKKFFLESLTLYREGRIPASAVGMLLNSWALSQKSDYISNQFFLEPFPPELVELRDGGRLLSL